MATKKELQDLLKEVGESLSIYAQALLEAELSLDAQNIDDTFGIGKMKLEVYKMTTRIAINVGTKKKSTSRRRSE